MIADIKFMLWRNLFMSKSNREKNRLKRKAKQKQRRENVSDQSRQEKGDFYFNEAIWYLESGKYDKAETLLKKSIKLNPENREMHLELARLGSLTDRQDLIVSGIMELRNRCLLDNNPTDNDLLLLLLSAMLSTSQYFPAEEIARELSDGLGQMRVRNRKQYKKKLSEIIAYADYQMHVTEMAAKIRENKALQSQAQSSGQTKMTSTKVQIQNQSVAAGTPVPAEKARDNRKKHHYISPSAPLPEIPIVLTMGGKEFTSAVSSASPASKAEYDLVIEAMQIRFKETFDHLLCLNTLSGITSLIYQEETARKILKTFRGRALLADEVGMGKTIEACIVIKEYMMRQMVKSVLVLAPTPLVSQWREELKTKFNLEFKSTDDPGARAEGVTFWDHPHIVASINIAKSAKNFSAVTSREYDLVIVDEAHHLKNRNTVNWKLVNTLKKRFLMLLTATPVENNLMELYNLITLLKPGQLKTASAFKDEFMTRGNPTDPKNRTQLKGLLDQVMIRNTRAVSNIKIPPRFAETIRTEPTAQEIELYDRVSGLILDINQSHGAKKKMILKHLLAEAGSSPAAVEKTLSGLLEKRELTIDQENEIRAVRSLCRSMGDTGKNAMALKLIRASKDKVIIFVKYRATLDHLSDTLSWHGISHSLFHGQLPNAKKDVEIAKFKADHQVLLSTELGGEGRNLQFCHQIINYDLPWNPMRIEQRIGRVHRIGQEKEVMIYNLCAAGTVEDYILEILDKKINMFEMVIGEIDMIIGRLRGEQDFSDIVYDIWVNSASEKERVDSFTKLSSQLKRCKTGYKKTKLLDETLFGENYEL